MMHIRREYKINCIRSIIQPSFKKKWRNEFEWHIYIWNIMKFVFDDWYDRCIIEQLQKKWLWEEQEYNFSMELWELGDECIDFIFIYVCVQSSKWYWEKQMEFKEAFSDMIYELSDELSWDDNTKNTALSVFRKEIVKYRSDINLEDIIINE